MEGIVQTGGRDSTPLAGVHVTLLYAADDESVEVARATTDSHGAFTIPDAPPRTEVYFVTADAGGGIVLMALLGNSLPPRVVVNELTTIAATYCAAQFLHGRGIRGDAFGLAIAAAMSTNLVNVADGKTSEVIACSPNGDETNAWRSLHSLANALAACVRDRGKALELLLELATPPGGSAPADTIAAFGNIARRPAQSAGGIYVLSKMARACEPALEEQPFAWTLAVKVNDSGDDAHMFAGPGNLAFDRRGRAWILNNVVQGTGVSTPWSIVLEASGRPADISPFTGGGLLGPGFGVDIDSRDRVWIGDFGWGKDNPVGSVSLFDMDAKPLSPEPDGFTSGGINRVQGTVVDADDNVWLASFGNGRVAVYPKGDPHRAVTYQDEEPDFAPFGIAIAKDGTAWVTSSSPKASGAIQLRLVDGCALELVRRVTIGKTLKGIAIDAAGSIWMGSGGDDHVYVLDAEGRFAGGFQGGGIDGPWGVCLDGDDNLWVANFGPLEVGTVFHGRVTQLAGHRSGHRLGDALTPQTGYTLPSAGAQVLLHDGTPLYGPGAPPSYIPMMRTTGVAVDAAGNVWTCNNWKPAFDVAVFGDPFTGSPNPGGDGMIIWLGLAKPVG
jgi:sugar lactone lactonase YvrE